jgi:putative tRNA adenosine deaminase-associated protein
VRDEGVVDDVQAHARNLPAGPPMQSAGRDRPTSRTCGPAGATMGAVAYFTAVIARTGSAWRARDVEVDDANSLEDLTDALRSVAVGDQPVLAVIEHEDEWFALVRVDGDDEPRLFVSDLYSAEHSHYGPLLAPAADVDSADEVAEDDDEDDDEDEDEDSDGADEEEPKLAAWAGETDLLEDLGVSGRTLRKLVEENGEDPGTVLAEVGEVVGFVELLDTLR